MSINKPGGSSNRRRIAGERSKTAPPPPKKPVRPRRPGKPAARTATKPAARTKPATAAPRTKPIATTKTRPARQRHDLRAALGSGREARWLAVLAVAATVVLVLGLVLGARAALDYRDARAAAKAGAAAAPEAGKAAETIFTFNYKTLDEHLEDAQALMTPAFAKKFAKVSPALDKLAPQRQVDVKASAREAAALECGNGCSADKVSVLVFVDQARTTSDTEVPTIFGQRVVMVMVKSGGKWKVSDIDAL